MTRTMHRARAGLFALAALALLAASSVVIVGEGDQAVITRFGAPLSVVNRFHPEGAVPASGAGAVFKLPFVDRVIWLARGLQGYSLGDQKVHTADAQVLLVDTDVTYRIIDPVRLVSSLGNADKIGPQIAAILPSLLEEELSQRPAGTIAQPGSGGSAKQILSALDGKLRAYGVQVVDLRIGRVVLPEGGQKLAFGRMDDRHNTQAWNIADGGAQEANQIVAEADATAAGILQKSASQDPEFYDYFSAMRSYGANFGDPARKGAATIVIPPDSDYLKHFNGK
ncbi:MAG: SPFH domain-containing protein [Pseudomonadota bacterium]|nr:SPFH domain-containing protein [Pseudomonadota bacterium]